MACPTQRPPQQVPHEVLSNTHKTTCAEARSTIKLRGSSLSVSALPTPADVLSVGERWACLACMPITLVSVRASTLRGLQPRKEQHTFPTPLSDCCPQLPPAAPCAPCRTLQQHDLYCPALFQLHFLHDSAQDESVLAAARFSVAEGGVGVYERADYASVSVPYVMGVTTE